jgi:hypothetical protein
MISFSHSEWFNAIYLGPFLLIILLLVLAIAYKVVGNIVNFIQQRLEYKKRFREVIEMKERGEVHEWINMAINLKRNAHVCKKTGYCPDLNGFFDVKYVQGIAKAQEQAKQLTLYRNRRVADIALKYGMEFDHLLNIMEEVAAIQKEFYVEKLDNLQQELKAVGKE